MDVDIGHFCFYLFGIFLSVCSVTGSHSYRRSHYHSYHYYYYYYYETDGNTSMIAGSIIGGLIAICIIIAIIVFVAHACNCKTHGVRGHTVQPAHVSTVTTTLTTPYHNMPQNGWYFLPPTATAPPYQDPLSKPPQYSTTDSNPPPTYEEISGCSAPTNTMLCQPGTSTPAPPYSPHGRNGQKL